MTIPGHRTLPGGVRGRFSADGRWLATIDLERLQVWNLATRERAWTLVEDGMKTGFEIAFTPGGRWVIVGRCGRLQRFDLQDVSPETTALILREFAGGISFVVSGDGRWLVTRDAPFHKPRARVPPAVRVYDLAAPAPAESGGDLPMVANDVRHVEISWDSRWITTRGDEGVRVWPLGVASLLDVAAATVGRGLTEEERARYLVL